MGSWGFFNKIKKGFKKVFNFAKDKIAKPVVDKVVKPVLDVAKKAAPYAAPLANTFIPGSGAIINGLIDNTDKVVNGDYSAIAEALRSGKIRLK